MVFFKELDLKEGLEINGDSPEGCWRSHSLQGDWWIDVVPMVYSAIVRNRFPFSTPPFSLLQAIGSPDRSRLRAAHFRQRWSQSMQSTALARCEICATVTCEQRRPELTAGVSDVAFHRLHTTQKVNVTRNLAR